MSLAVARKERQYIFIIADTRLSDGEILPNEHRPDRVQMVADPRNSAIKITLLQPQIAVAFAGGSLNADEAIRECRGKSPEQIINILLESHRSSKNEIDYAVDYIVALGQPIFDLISIKDGQVNAGQPNCWIGDRKAFAFYQENLSNLQKQDVNHVHQTLYHCQQAFKAVLESNQFLTVKGFGIAVEHQAGCFLYKQSITTEILPFTITGTHPAGAGVVIGHGSPQAGGYTIDICPDPRFPNILPIHILQGDVGIIYQPKDNGLLQPKVLPQTDAIEFSEILQTSFGIPIRYRLTAPIKSYFNRGIKALQAGDLPTAITFFEKGLKEPGQELKSLLNINMASALHFSGHTTKAIPYAYEAVRLDPNNYQAWQKILATARRPPKKGQT